MFAVELASAPTADVWVQFVSDTPAEGKTTPDPTTLRFKPASWKSAQYVTVTGVDDDVDDGDIPYGIAVSVTSDDPAYGTLEVDAIAAMSRDDDTAEVALVALDGELITSESRGTARLAVRLKSEPLLEVKLGFASSDPSEGTVFPEQLTFTASDWSSPKLVTVQGVDDRVQDGAVKYELQVTVDSADAKYAALTVPSLELSNSDDDVAAVVVAPQSGVEVSEYGTSASLSFVLSAAPTAPVTVPLSVSDETEAGLSAAQVVFGPDDWSQPKTVEVTGLGDAESDGDVAFTIVTGKVVSEDGAFDGIDPPDVAGTNQDAPVERVSVASAGAASDGDNYSASISGDGRYVAFLSSASNLVPSVGPPSEFSEHVYRFDRVTRETRLVSKNSLGLPGNGDCDTPVIATGGDVVVFVSRATNLVSTALAPNTMRVYLRDLVNNTTELVAVTSSETALSGMSLAPAVSADGRYVAFLSTAKLDVGDAGDDRDVFLRDRGAGTTTQLTVGINSAGASSNWGPTLSEDGRWLAFDSGAWLVSPGTGKRNVYMLDRQATPGAWTLLSKTSSAQAWSGCAVLSGDGSTVVFQSDARDLVTGDGTQQSDFFARTLNPAAIQRCTVAKNGGELDAPPYLPPSVSRDGKLVSFLTIASNTPERVADSSSTRHGYVRDLLAGTTRRVTLAWDGELANAGTDDLMLSADGRWVAFSTEATNLIPDDANHERDVFVARVPSPSP